MGILAIDQGTTGTTCIIYNENGVALARAYRELTQIYPEAGWVEHDPEEIWQTVVECIEEIRQINACPIKAIGITNQRETTIVWEKRNGKAVHNAIVWQCRRTSEFCKSYEAEMELIAIKTGLPVDAYFSATKIRWILDHHPELNPDELLFGTVDSWLLWNMTNGKVHATDFTNASRTLLYNIVKQRWDDDLCRLFGIPTSMLPEVRQSMSDFGSVTAFRGVEGVPVMAIAGDQQAALFGQCCFEPGSTKNTYGTGCFMMMNTGDRFVRSLHGLLTTLAISANGTPCYAIEGSVFVGGAVIQWLRDGLQLIKNASESEQMAVSAGTNGGVYLVPAFVGLGAPHWNMDARGTIVGLTRGTERRHIIRASLESIAYQSYDIFQAITADTGIEPAGLTVDGGAVSNNFLMQFQADLLGIPIRRPQNIESTSLGAAYLAGLQVGMWPAAEALKELNPMESSFFPAIGNNKKEELLNGWRKAVRQTLAE